MGELSSSIAEAFRRRAVSATYGTFIFFWVSLHWQGLYTTFFTSEEIIYKQHGLLKNEYVRQYFFGWRGWWSILELFSIFILTFLFIWVVPRYILIHAYREEQKNKINRLRVKIEEEAKLEQKKESLAKQRTKTLNAEVKAVRTRKRAMESDPQVVWQREFNEFAKSKQYLLFGQILKSMYEYNGDIVVEGQYSESADIFRLSPEALKLGDVKGLLVILGNGSKINLTDKGKYFASQFEQSF